MGRQLGLIGFPLHHSKSPDLFRDLFRTEALPGYRYELFPLPDLSGLFRLLEEQPELSGLNVTVPYKESVIPYLDEMDPLAVRAGAVNVIVRRNGILKGYNTDVEGFRKSSDFHGQTHALVLGTGGSSRAICLVLKEMGVVYHNVSRSPDEEGVLPYEALDEEVIRQHTLIINTTPLGMFPNQLSCPDIPYERLTSEHFLYDLVYNPDPTLFMKKGASRGARVQSGKKMLEIQAKESLKIFLQP